MQIESFSVSGFRSLAEVSDIPLRCPTVLTGRNDSGKTATLAALAFLLRAHTLTTDDVREDAEGAQIVVTCTARLTETEQKHLDLGETIRLRRRGAAGSRAVYEIEREVPREPLLRNLDESLALGVLKDRAQMLGIEPDGPKGVKETYLKALRARAVAEETVIDWMTVADGDLNLPEYFHLSGADGANLRSQLTQALRITYRRILSEAEFTERVKNLEEEISLKLAAELEDLCDLIQERCDGYEGVTILPIVSVKDALSDVRVMADRNGRRVNFDHVGTGRQRQLNLAVWEWSNRQVSTSVQEEAQNGLIIAYDEPDTHLDFVRQREFMDLVRVQCANPGVRMMVATHSVNLIDRVPLENVAHLRLVGGQTAVERLATHDDSDYGQFVSRISDELGLPTSAVLFERCFLLVEGATEKVAFPRLFHLVTGRRLQESGIVLFDSGGNTTVLTFVGYLRDLGREVHVIVDHDSKKDHPKIFEKDKLTARGITSDHIDYVGDPNELEELFTDAQWAATANESWPRSDHRLWIERDIHDLRGTGKFSGNLSTLLRDGSGERVSKPALLSNLAQRLRSRDEVPEVLVEIFDRLAAE
ncbi:TOPRIM nucleotidyl transferase/hydrolase domain-containing protein [Sphaerisporangium sp. NPDC088356]|uniref:AAA family ATPase n=1 Tax=Sphaerisporangium sp. NPDC088356 TaxID=3154871 RepID=UPI00343C0FAC